MNPALRCILLSVIGIAFLVVEVRAESASFRQLGAKVYLQRCALCHGSKGLGEGPVPLLVPGYPDTSLKAGTTDDEILRHIVESGGNNSSNHSLSPPWDQELSRTEINAVTSFVKMLRTDFDSAVRELSSVNISPQTFDGRKIYRARCERCHGTSGKGDGRIARIMRDPSPSDLTLSTLSRSETLAIVSAGGAAIGRSASMPPWGQEFHDLEMLSVIDYLFTLRNGSIE